MMMMNAVARCLVCPVCLTFLGYYPFFDFDSLLIDNKARVELKRRKVKG